MAALPPREVLYEIALFCDQETQYSLCRVSRGWSAATTPALYRHVVLTERKYDQWLSRPIHSRAVVRHGSFPASLAAIVDRARNLAKSLLTNRKAGRWIQSLEISAIPWADSDWPVLSDPAQQAVFQEMPLFRLVDPTLYWLSKLPRRHALAASVAVLLYESGNLEELRISGMMGLDFLIENSQSKPPPLRRLYYNSGSPGNEGVTTFLHLPNLEQLLLVGCCNTRMLGGWDFPKSPARIRKLAMTDIMITEELLHIMKALPGLTWLKVVFNVDEDDLDYPFIQDMLDECLNLVYLNLGVIIEPGVQVPDASANLSALIQLKSLTIPAGWIFGDKLSSSLTHLHLTHSANPSKTDEIRKLLPDLTISESKKL